jgi:hypothetical protein
MPDLPARFAAIILAFAPLFRHRTWRHAEVLLLGAILAPGKRTVTSLLRITGLSRERHFVNYHRVLSRACWSGREAAHLLLGLLIDTFVPAGPVIFGLDDTIERRRGKRITAKGIYRDPVRSSDAHFVKASGLRWISLMLLAPIPWAARTWALPFLTALAPSKRYCREQGKQPKKLTDWARQMVLQVRRWLPERELVLVTDMGFAALELRAALSRRGVICITRLRLDAALYEPAPPRPPGTNGRPRTKGARLPNLADVLIRASTRWRRVTVPGWYGEGERVIEFCSATAVWRHSGMPIVPIRWILLRDPHGRFSPQALLCTDPMRDPLQIIRWFILRWQVEVTFQEARAHLGVETQRQWSDRAVARTTPCLFGLFSIVTLLAAQLGQRTRTAVWVDSWYRKSYPTFADALAAVRRDIWRETGLLTSRNRHKTPKPTPTLRQCLAYALCYAA